MAIDKEIILSVKTNEAVTSVKELKENIKAYKEQLEGLDIGTKEYKDTLDVLKVNQNALKDAMYATSASMTDIAKAATGTSETYNGLVHRMASLKEGLRNIDTSTAEGREQFKKMAKQVDEVNSRLKEMDEMQGNYQRSVGSYKVALKGIGDKIDALGKGMKALKSGTEGAKGAMEGIAKSPMMGTIGLLVAAASNLAVAMKDNDQAMEAVKKAMSALKPLMDMFSGIMEKMVGILADVLGKVMQFITNNGILDKLMNGIMGVGNAIVQYVIAPFKGVIAAIKVFKEQGIKGIGDAAKAFGNEMKNGVSFKKNFETGKAMVDTMIAGAKSKKKDVGKAGDDLAKEMNDRVAKRLAIFNIWLQEWDRIHAEWVKDTEALDKELDEERDATLDDIEEFFEEQARLRQMDLDDAEAKAKAKVETMKMVSSATSSILGSIADYYEANEESSKQNAKRIKALRIASTTIDTITGAISAYMSVWKSELPLSMKAVAAPLQSAAVLAAGMANIAKIKNTDATGASSTTANANASAVTSAPVLNSQVSQVRTITSASEDQRLNQMASSQRVYILQSDIQASLNASKTQVAESSF